MCHLKLVVDREFVIIGLLHVYTFYMCTVHRTVISIEHFAIASASFFVLLANSAVQRKE